MDLGTERSAISGTSRKRYCSSDVQTRTIHTPIWAESNSASAEDSMHRRRLRSKLSCVLAAESHIAVTEYKTGRVLSYRTNGRSRDGAWIFGGAGGGEYCE